MIWQKFVYPKKNSNLLILVILVIAVVLRTWNLPNNAIFFGDAGRDLLVASHAVANKQLPLRGIPSSVPRFHQGPLSIWLSMVVNLFFGFQLLPYSITYSLLASASVCGLYWLLSKYTQLPAKTILLSTFLLAVAPLAVVQARMPYHTTPIPLMIVFFLVGARLLWQNHRLGLFWALLGWSGVFQFELATFSLILVIPYILWRHKRSVRELWSRQAALALGIGLLPQILYDLTHQFQQLGLFLVWILYRLGGSLVSSSHHLSLAQLLAASRTIALYIGRIWSPDLKIVQVLGLSATALIMFFLIKHAVKSHLPAVIEISLVGTFILLLSFMIHGAPSEAYFPPLLIFLPIVVGYGISQLPESISQISVGLLCLNALVSCYILFSHNFLTSTDWSWQYGPSVQEQREILNLIQNKSGSSFQLQTTSPAGSFPSYFDNFRWLALETNMQETDQSQDIYLIETKDSPLMQYPSAIKYIYPSVDVYQIQ